MIRISKPNFNDSHRKIDFSQKKLLFFSTGAKFFFWGKFWGKIAYPWAIDMPNLIRTSSHNR